MGGGEWFEGNQVGGATVRNVILGESRLGRSCFACFCAGAAVDKRRRTRRIVCRNLTAQASLSGCVWPTFLLSRAFCAEIKSRRSSQGTEIKGGR